MTLFGFVYSLPKQRQGHSQIGATGWFWPKTSRHRVGLYALADSWHALGILTRHGLPMVQLFMFSGG